MTNDTFIPEYADNAPTPNYSEITPYQWPRVIVVRKKPAVCSAEISLWCNISNIESALISVSGIQDVCALMSGEYPDQSPITASDLIVLDVYYTWSVTPRDFSMKSTPGYKGRYPLSAELISWHRAMRKANEGLPSILFRTCDQYFLKKYRSDGNYRDLLEGDPQMCNNGDPTWKVWKEGDLFSPNDPT